MKFAVSGSRARTIAGLVMFVGLAPFLLALMACLEVPVGDPEKSRVDPALSGVWRAEAKGENGLWIIEPWDERTWILTILETKGDDDEDEPASTTTTNDVTQVDEELESQGAYKTWLATFSGVRFLVLEPKQVVRETGGMKPEFWFVFKVTQSSTDRIELRLVDPGPFEEVETTAEAEAILAKRANDPGLFGDDSEKFVLLRVPEAEYGDVEERLKAMGIFAY